SEMSKAWRLSWGWSTRQPFSGRCRRRPRCRTRRLIVPVAHGGLSSQKNSAQHDGIVVLFVMGRIDERNPAFSRQCAEPRELFGVRAQLLNIASAELLPAGRIVPKPFAQSGAWCDVLHPLIYGCVCFPDPARP